MKATSTTRTIGLNPGGPFPASSQFWGIFGWNSRQKIVVLWPLKIWIDTFILGIPSFPFFPQNLKPNFPSIYSFSFTIRREEKFLEKKGRRGRKIFNRKFFYHREFEEISGEDRYRDIVRRPRQNLVADEVLCFFFACEFLLGWWKPVPV